MNKGNTGLLPNGKHELVTADVEKTEAINTLALAGKVSHTYMP